MYRIHDIEDALVTALKNAGIAARPYHLSAEGQNLEREAGGTPVALVAYAGAEAAKVRTFASRAGMDYTFHVYASARNLRDISATGAARGDVASSGIYGLLAAVRTALGGNRLGLLIQPLRLAAETALVKTPRLSVYRQDWRITVVE